jgi:D-alanyl-D-alanine carboxypeptidase
LICVTLNAPNDWADHAALFDEGFANYRGQVLTKAGETLCRLPIQDSLLSFCSVNAEKTVSAALAAGEKAELSLQLDVEMLTAPIAAGTQVGEAIFTQNGLELGRTPLVTGQNVSCDVAPKLGFWARWKEQFS